MWTVVPPKICFNKIFIEFKSNFELILGNNGNLRVYSVVNVPLKEFPGDRSCLFYKINTQKEVAIFEPDTRPTQTPNVCKLEPQIPSILNWASGKLCIFLQVWQSNMHPRNQTGLSFLTKGNCGSPGYRFFLSPLFWFIATLPAMLQAGSLVFPTSYHSSVNMLELYMHWPLPILTFSVSVSLSFSESLCL